MKEKPTYHYHVLRNASSMFPWSPEGVKMFSQVDTKPILHIAKNLQFDARVTSMPCRSQRQCITMFVGCALVILAEPQQVIPYSDFHNQVVTAHHTFFQKGQVVLMSPGDSFFVLLCVTPLVVGLPFDEGTGAVIPGTKGAKKSTSILAEYCAFTVACPWDKERDLTHSAEATTYAASSFVSALGMMPAAIKNCAGVQAWKRPWRNGQLTRTTRTRMA